MNTRIFSRLRVSFNLVVLTAIILFILLNCGCKNSKNINSQSSKGKDTSKAWISWNVLFEPGANTTERNQSVQRIRDYIQSAINAYNNSNNPDFGVNYHVYFCPCDTLLYNIDATPLAGVAVTPPPPPPPPKGGSGDSVLYVSNNNFLEIEPQVGEDSLVTNSKLGLTNRPISNKKVLAIIDTGIDTTLFPRGGSHLLWNHPSQATMYNFLPGQSVNNLDDDHALRHGTAVAALALRAMDLSFPHSPEYFKLMILKALDKNKEGSTFSVSCAMSYAIQNNATLINASLGYHVYHNEIDSILRHYVQLCNPLAAPGIPIIAAAGNRESNLEVHTEALTCVGRQDAGTLLNQNRLFYPACFSIENPMVISVTGLKNPDTACYFQNYSNTFVTVGVFNERGCCKFRLPIVSGGYEGSSFATPVVAGMVMGCLISGGPNADPIVCLNSLESQVIGTQVTKDGKYVTYKGNQ